MFYALNKTVKFSLNCNQHVITNVLFYPKAQHNIYIDINNSVKPQAGMAEQILMYYIILATFTFLLSRHERKISEIKSFYCSMQQKDQGYVIYFHTWSYFPYKCIALWHLTSRTYQHKAQFSNYIFADMKSSCNPLGPLHSF